MQSGNAASTKSHPIPMHDNNHNVWSFRFSNFQQMRVEKIPKSEDRIQIRAGESISPGSSEMQKYAK
jgi:hypothetical protein